MKRLPPLTGDEMRRLRDELDLTQAAFGELLGVDRQAVWTWENKTRRPTAMASRLARHYQRLHQLGVPVSLLLNDDVSWLDTYVRTTLDK